MAKAVSGLTCACGSHMFPICHNGSRMLFNNVTPGAHNAVGQKASTRQVRRSSYRQVMTDGGMQLYPNMCCMQAPGDQQDC